MHEFKRKAAAAAFAQSDYDRSVTAFKAIWSKYFGEGKLWGAKAQRAVQYSGVPAEQVEEMVTDHYNVTTPLLIKYGICSRPMAQPPFQISG